MAKKVTDNKTLKLIEEVKKQKNEIAKTEKLQWKTNCSFSYNNGTAPINIHVESNVEKLISMGGFLLMSEHYYNESKARLEIDAGEFTWNGFSVNDWIEDIRSRLNRIQLTSKRKKLEILENRLNAIISPELRAEMELKSIEEDLF